MDAHGYVFTYPGSFCAFIGTGWVWGICIGVGLCVVVDCKVFGDTLSSDSSGTDTHSFFYVPVAKGVIGDDRFDYLRHESDSAA